MRQVTLCEEEVRAEGLDVLLARYGFDLMHRETICMRRYGNGPAMTFSQARDAAWGGAGMPPLQVYISPDVLRDAVGQEDRQRYIDAILLECGFDLARRQDILIDRWLNGAVYTQEDTETLATRVQAVERQREEAAQERAQRARALWLERCAERSIHDGEHRECGAVQARPEHVGQQETPVPSVVVPIGKRRYQVLKTPES
jgi:hypothetical protein